MFINGFELPENNNGIVYFPGSPRQYRADCKAGIFKIGETSTVTSLTVTSDQLRLKNKMVNHQ